MNEISTLYNILIQRFPSLIIYLCQLLHHFTSNVCKHKTKQTFSKGWRVHLYMENLYFMGLWHCKRWNCPQQGIKCNFERDWIFLYNNVYLYSNTIWTIFHLYQVASIIMSLRESLVEESAKEKEKEKNWETIAKRVLANLIFILLLLGSAYLVIWVVERSQEKTNSWYRQNEITIVMSLISMIMPMFFDIIALLEDYHPRKAMRWMLARIMALNLLR